MLFSDYMGSTANIITLIEINDFLDQPENADILRKHFKLWIESTNILTDILTNDIFIDSDSLLYNVEEDSYLFVQTTAFDRAIDCLENNNVLIIIGNPGVGKSITSKMVVLYYASFGYRVRYTTDGCNLAELKKSLSQSFNAKEIILLDDCFGQAYFSMKETQENELLSLVRHIKRNPNKLLLMNSRVTIYQEAKERTPNLVKSLEHKEYKAFVLDMDNISLEEKAKIFYNHLYFCKIPQPYFENIKKGRKYRQIVKHKNYNPRIIEFVCDPKQMERVASDQYSDFIIHCLNNPEQIWKNEYEKRLANTDRILLTTLYSMTNTTIPLKMVRKCYNYRLGLTYGIDNSINHFDQAILRLSNSMIKQIDVKGIKMLSTANPSVNDFLRTYLANNSSEQETLIKSCFSIIQMKRLLDEKTYYVELERIFSDKTVLRFAFESEQQKNDFIAYYCAEHKVLDSEYQPYLQAFLINMHDTNIYENHKIPLSYLLDRIFDVEFCSFYDLDGIVQDFPTLISIIEGLELSDAICLINMINFLFEGQNRKSYLNAVRTALVEAIDKYCTDIPADAYDVDVASILADCTYDDEIGSGYIDGNAATEIVEDSIKDMAISEVSDMVSSLPSDIIKDINYLENLSISVSGSTTLVEGYLTDGPDYDYDDYYEDQVGINDKIDYIFNR